MGNRPRADTLALRDQILAALRAQGGFPLPTREVRKLLGMRDWMPSGGHEARCEGCDGWHLGPVKRYPEEQRVYVALRALVASGQVDREYIEGRVYWRAQPADVAELEAMLEGSTDG